MYLYWFATEEPSIPYLNSQSSFSMCTVSHKTKTFISLHTNIFNGSSTKSMEMTVEIN